MAFSLEISGTDHVDDDEVEQLIERPSERSTGGRYFRSLGCVVLVLGIILVVVLVITVDTDELAGFWGQGEEVHNQGKAGDDVKNIKAASKETNMTLHPYLLSTSEPTSSPTGTIASPTASPTVEPTFNPTTAPTSGPSAEPSAAETVQPPAEPTSTPSIVDTHQQIEGPSLKD